MNGANARGAASFFKEKQGGPTDRSSDSFRLCIRHEQGRQQRTVAGRVAVLEQRERQEHTHNPTEFRSSERLRKARRTVLGRVAGIGWVNRPSTGTYHSSYTCLTTSGNSKREIKRISELRGAYKPTCRTYRWSTGAFAPNTARIQIPRPGQTDSSNSEKY